MKKTGVLFLAITCVMLPALANQTVLDAAIDKYPFIDDTRLDTCALCHTDPPALNPYGTELLEAELVFEDVEYENPDGDLVGSLDEINALTFPGDGTDFPIVTVPDVVGLAQATAEADIVAASLTVGTITQAASDTVPAGDVISQEPVADTEVQQNSMVNLIVSTGSDLIMVPDVVGLAQAAAETAIVAANLTVGTITQAASDTVPSGEVISQTPAAGTEVMAGTAVNITISTGPAGTTGFLQVIIQPEEAREAGAQWRIDDGPFRDSGETVELAVGAYTVSFSDTVCDNVGGCFGGCAKTAAAKQAGFPRLDALGDTAVRRFFDTFDVTKQGGGCFAPCIEFATPSDEAVNITADQTCVVTAIYTEIDKTAAVAGSVGGDMLMLFLMAAGLIAARRISRRKA